MKTVGLLLALTAATMPISAHARTWVMENAEDATCDTLPADGVANPQDFADQLRSQGTIPTITPQNGSDGTLDNVTISYTASGGNNVGAQFFTSMSGCQTQLKADLADGDVTDPNALK